jgi:hypothetical protein
MYVLECLLPLINAQDRLKLARRGFMDLRCRAPRAADSSEVDTVGGADEIAEDDVEKLRWEAVRPWRARFTRAAHGGI